MNTRTAAARRAAAPLERGARTRPLYRLAWRNVWRQKRRTVLLIIVVAYATLSTVFFWGFTDGYTRSIIYNQSRYLNAPVLVTTPAYQDDPDPENALPGLGFLPQLEGVRGVRGYAPRLELFALLRSPYTSESARVRGVDPAREAQVSDLPASVTEGRMLTGRGEVVLSVDLAQRLDMRLGERLAMDVSSLAGPQAAGLRLVGLIDSGIAAVDGGAVLIHLEDARALTGVETATGVAVDAPRGQEEEVAARLNEVLPTGVRAYDILELLGPLRAELEGARVQMIPIGLLFALFASLAVTSTVLVSVLERTREFGVMAAVGLAPPKLARMVVIEAVVATSVGWLVGLVLGYLLTWLFGTYNLLGPALGAASDSFAAFGLSDEIYTASSPEYALYAALTVAFAGTFALLIPARRVAKLNPVTAMRAD